MIGVFSLLFFTPIEAPCFSNSSAEIISRVQLGDQNSVFHAFEELQQANVTLSEGRKFLISLIDEINAQYHMSLTLADACRLIKENLHAMQIPLDQQRELLIAIGHIDPDCFPESTSVDDIHLQEKASVEVFGRKIYWPWEWKWFGLNSSTHHHKSEDLAHFTAHSPSRDLELPPKMAAGFACALGGALICIVPGGQGIGLGLIATGLGLTLDGLASGERPFYVDRATGEKIPFRY